MSTETNKVVMELIVDGRGAIRTLDDFNRATDKAAAGVTKLESAEDRLNSAHAKIAEARARDVRSMTLAYESTGKLAMQYRRIEESLDPALKATRTYERQLAKVDQAILRGVTTETAAARTIAQLQNKKIADLARLEAATESAAAATGRLGAANDNLAWRRRQTQFQLFDIAQGLALGSNPALVAMQQGPQLLQNGARAAFDDIKVLAAGAARSFGPIAVAVGAVSLGFAGMAHEINKTSKTAVTFGDVALGTFDVIRDAIYDVLRPAIAAIGPWFSAAWDLVVAGVKWAGNVFVATWTIGFDALRTTVASIPDAFIVAGEAAANGFLRAINEMLRAAIVMINTTILRIRDGFREAGMDALADFADKATLTNKVPLWKVDLGGADALERLREAWGDFTDRSKANLAADAMGALFDLIGGAAGERARKRLEEIAKETGEASKAAREAEQEYQRFLGVADGLAEKMFPGEYALREARDLLGLLDKFGWKLDQFQRAAIDARIGDLFTAASLGVRDLERETGASGDNIMALIGDIGQAAAGIFQGAKESVWDWVDAPVTVPAGRLAILINAAFGAGKGD